MIMISGGETFIFSLCFLNKLSSMLPNKGGWWINENFSQEGKLNGIGDKEDRTGEEWKVWSYSKSKDFVGGWWWQDKDAQHNSQTSTTTTSSLCGYRYDIYDNLSDNNILILARQKQKIQNIGRFSLYFQVPVSIIGAGAVLIVVAIIATWIYKKCR